MVNHRMKGLSPCSHFFLLEADNVIAELLQTLIQVLIGKYYAWPTRQGFYIHASISHTSQEKLHTTHSIDRLQMVIRLHMVCKGWSKVMLGVESHTLVNVLRSHLETLRNG